MTVKDLERIRSQIPAHSPHCVQPFIPELALDPALRRALEKQGYVVEAHGEAHILINNAGVTVYASFEEHDIEDLEWILGVNLWGVIYGCKSFLPHLKASGEGHIVNVSSIAGFLPFGSTDSPYPEDLWAWLAETGEESGVRFLRPLRRLARRDPLWRLVARVVEGIFFFQPLNALAARRLGADVRLVACVGEDAAADEAGDAADGSGHRGGRRPGDRSPVPQLPGDRGDDLIDAAGAGSSPPASHRCTIASTEVSGSSSPNESAHKIWTASSWITWVIPQSKWTSFKTRSKFL